jgi:hypothetical protein
MSRQSTAELVGQVMVDVTLELAAAADRVSTKYRETGDIPMAVAFREFANEICRSKYSKSAE